MPALTEYEFRRTVAVLSQNCPSYRELLVTDPKAAIETLIQKELPDDFDVKLVEETPDEITFVIPPFRAETMCDDDLELVAGGVGNVAAGGDIGIVFDNSINFITNNFTFLGDVQLNKVFANYAPKINIDMSWFGLA